MAYYLAGYLIFSVVVSLVIAQSIGYANGNKKPSD
jgi:hypothetical protein